MRECVLDASVLLALLNQEPGWEALTPVLETGCMSAVNLAEAAGKLADRGLSESDLQSIFGELGLEIHPFDAHQALTAGLLLPATRGRGLSLGDRACLALARTLGRPAVTMDRVWAELDLEIEVRLGR